VSDSRPDIAGACFHEELVEQPDALLRLLDGASAVIDAGRAIRRRRPRFVRLVAHGSSDNAAVFGTYAFGLLAGVPAFRASISMSVYYGADDGRALARRRAVAVGAHAGRRRIRRPGAAGRGADDRRDERPRVRAGRCS